MDDARFDDLVRALASTTPRRHLLHLLARSLPIGLLIGLGAHDAQARACADHREACDERIRCCRGLVCQNGRCACGGDLTDQCDDRCRDLDTDPEHCGECGERCAADETCCGGSCCPDGPPFGCCDGECVNVDRTDAHCGGCGQGCRDGSTCCFGRCRDLQSDERYCGSCDTSCTQGQGICREGVCHCKPPFACGAPSNRCGRQPGARCRQGEECCSGFCFSPSHQPSDRQCAPCRGISCASDTECCDGFKCQPTSAGAHCGGCIAMPLDHPCDPARAECCFADCTENPSKPGEFRCSSRQGGPCAQDTDCWSCRLDVSSASCPGTCVGGQCVR